LGALGALGIAFGGRVQSALSSAIGSGLGGLIPGGNMFRIYTITGSFPDIPPEEYRLEVSGMVDRPVLLTLADLQSMPSTKLVRDFQCVTGWRVDGVHWEGVRLSDVLDAVGISPRAKAVTFDSYDGADTESLTIGQARLPDVLVAYRMLGAPITVEHGGPVRLYVARMYGYKSIKWLSAIRAVEVQVPGFWEQNGYPVDAWVDGSLAAATKNIGPG
jgi:DMSO/TMAO reductase YedYZ molybdopterin-dependent catalytic subunit